ncbi:MAG: hypothetical protein EPO36_03025 [Chloroflexota bacterium]|nr:MAG: hypothetical protein EPO36_03025 [Chloroflexota bacterium]
MPSPASTPSATPPPIPGGPDFHVVLDIQPAHPVSGDVVTLTPVWPGGYAIASSAHCRWSLAWGSTAALRNEAWDETFGAVDFAGPASKGYCGAWVFTLPYSAAGQWLYTFRAQMADGLVLGHEETILRGTNGAPKGAGIASSNLPLGWLSLSAHPTAGSLVTATLHQVGGFVAPRNGQWHAQSGSGPGLITGVAQGTGGSTWTFTPTDGGTWTVFYNAPGTGVWGDDLYAAVDPRIAPAAPKPPSSPAVTPESAASAALPSPTRAATFTTSTRTAAAASEATPAVGNDSSPQPAGPAPTSGSIGGAAIAVLLGLLAMSAVVGVFVARRRRRRRPGPAPAR